MKLTKKRNINNLLTMSMLFFLEINCGGIFVEALGLPLPNYLVMFSNTWLQRIIFIIYFLVVGAGCFVQREGINAIVMPLLVANLGLAVSHFVQKALLNIVPKQLSSLIALASGGLLLFFALSEQKRFFLLPFSAAYPSMYFIISVFRFRSFITIVFFYCIIGVVLFVVEKVVPFYFNALCKSVWAGILAIFLLHTLPLFLSPFDKIHGSGSLDVAARLPILLIWAAVIAACFITNIMYDKVKQKVVEKAGVGSSDGAKV